jgi:MYXO-CTERM domain-containing protein
MKNFSGSFSRLVVSASTLGVTMFAAPAVAGIGDIDMRTDVTRLATAAGLTDNYSTGSVKFAGDQLISATRPNGQSDWGPLSTSSLYQIATAQGPGSLTGAEIDSWMESNARGWFSATWRQDTGPWPGTYQTSADYSSFYVAPTAMTYMELTQSSIALFNDIIANGRTGTFTFNTTQNVVTPAGYYQAGANIMLSGGVNAVSSPTMRSGNAFTVNIASALSANTLLTITATPGVKAFQPISNYAIANNARYSYNASTLYSAAPVPTPGALALLALAGAAGGRRRRG